MYKFLNLLEYVISLAISLRIAGWVLGSPERSPSSLDVAIADVKWTPKSKALNHLISQHTVMRGWNKKRRRGNYDSADYMETKWIHKADEKCRHWGLFDSTSFHHLPYQPSSRLSGLVSDCTGISVKGLGLALACFSDVGWQHRCVCAVYME